MGCEEGCVEVYILWPGVVSLGCEEGTVLQDVFRSVPFGQVWFLWAVRRGVC